MEGKPSNFARLQWCLERLRARRTAGDGCQARKMGDFTGENGEFSWEPDAFS